MGKKEANKTNMLPLTKCLKRFTSYTMARANLTNPLTFLHCSRKQQDLSWNVTRQHLLYIILRKSQSRY